MFSTMITVASTTRPKSIAPTDSRLADSPRITISPMANDNANGMVSDDDQRAAQVAEEHPLQQEDQRDAASMLCSTVCVVTWISSVRS